MYSIVCFVSKKQWMLSFSCICVLHWSITYFVWLVFQIFPCLVQNCMIIIYTLFNRMAMGRAWLIIYLLFFNRVAAVLGLHGVFFFRWFVGDQTQTSLGQTSNDTTYDVYSSKAVKTLMYWKFMNILLFILCKIYCLCVIEVLDSKQVLNTEKARLSTSFMDCVDIATFSLGRRVEYDCSCFEL